MRTNRIDYLQLATGNLKLSALLSYPITATLLVLMTVLPSQAASLIKPVRSIQADFSQEKHLPILIQPLLSHGTFAFQAPDSLRWEYQAPLKSLLIMDQGKVQKFIERDGRLQQERGSQVDAMQVILTEIRSWLDGQLDNSPTFKLAGQQGQTITLLPRQASLATMISAIELQVAADSGLLDTVIIREGPEAYTKLSFSNRQIDLELDRSRFQP